MQAFSSAIKGLFGYGQVPGADTHPTQTSQGIDLDPVPDDVLGTQLPAAPEPDATAVERAQTRLNQAPSPCPTLPNAPCLKKVPPGLAGALATALTGATTMATVLIKHGEASAGSVVLASAAAAVGGFVAGGFIELGYRASAEDDAARRQQQV